MEHQDAVQRVIDYIEENLQTEIDNATLAQVLDIPNIIFCASSKKLLA